MASPIVVGEGAGSVAAAVMIRLTDRGFLPAYVEATNGHDLTVTLVNTGTRRHRFVIEHFQIHEDLLPGQRATILIQSPDLGDFAYYSDAPGDNGMVGLLTFYI